VLKLDLVRDPDAPCRVLALGAHCDDIEIGCGGTLLSLLAAHRNLCFDWVVFTSNPVRAREAQASAERLLRGAKEKRVVVKEFRNGYFPDQWARIKDEFEALKAEVRPDVVFTHHAQDLHQDHRTLAELTWNTFRDHLIVEAYPSQADKHWFTPEVFLALMRLRGVQCGARYAEAFYARKVCVS
jgi:LmbE family N-acetylglucosaminyl deacetylase